LEVTSFVYEDGKLATVVLNRSDKELKYVLRVDGQLLDRVIPAHAIETVVLEA
jgi:glucosylceramidase